LLSPPKGKVKLMIAGVAFDIYAGQFAAGEAAVMLGIKGPVLAMWGQRGLWEPTRREGAPERRGHRTSSKRGSPKGKPLFSARDIFKAHLLHMLSEQMGMRLSKSVEVAEEVKEPRERVAELVSAIEAAELANTVAMTGEWMWAVARAYERGKRLHVYLYASRPNLKWQFDMHVGELGEPPCFGWEMPHLYLPVSDIFITVYTACKKLLGLSEVTASEEV
jgi:hypothetical protein